MGNRLLEQWARWTHLLSLIHQAGGSLTEGEWKAFATKVGYDHTPKGGWFKAFADGSEPWLMRGTTGRIYITESGRRAMYLGIARLAKAAQAPLKVAA